MVEFENVLYSRDLKMVLIFLVTKVFKILMPVWRHVSLRWLFKMAGKVDVDEEDKIIGFLTLMLFHFLRFGDIKIRIEIENQYIVLIFDETFRGVMIF